MLPSICPCQNQDMTNKPNTYTQLLRRHFMNPKCKLSKGNSLFWFWSRIVAIGFDIHRIWNWQNRTFTQRHNEKLSKTAKCGTYHHRCHTMGKWICVLCVFFYASSLHRKWMVNEKKETKMAEIRRKRCHCLENWTQKPPWVTFVLKIHRQMSNRKRFDKNLIKISANKQNKNKYLKVDLFGVLLSKPSLVANIRLRTHLRALFLWFDGKNFCPFNCARSHCHKTTLLHNKYTLFVHTGHRPIGVINFQLNFAPNFSTIQWNFSQSSTSLWMMAILLFEPPYFFSLTQWCASHSYRTVLCVYQFYFGAPMSLSIRIRFMQDSIRRTERWKGKKINTQLYSRRTHRHGHTKTGTRKHLIHIRVYTRTHTQRQRAPRRSPFFFSLFRSVSSSKVIWFGIIGNSSVEKVSSGATMKKLCWKMEFLFKNYEKKSKLFLTNISMYFTCKLRKWSHCTNLIGIFRFPHYNRPITMPYVTCMLVYYSLFSRWHSPIFVYFL